MMGRMAKSLKAIQVAVVITKGMKVKNTMMPIKWRVMPMKMFQLPEMLATRRMVMWLVLMMARIHSYVHVVIIFISITFQ